MPWIEVNTTRYFSLLWAASSQSGNFSLRMVFSWAVWGLQCRLPEMLALPALPAHCLPHRACASIRLPAQHRLELLHSLSILRPITVIAFNCLKTAALILYFCAFLVKKLSGADSNFRHAISGPIHLSTKWGNLLQKGKSLDYFTVVNDHKLELTVIDYIIQIYYNYNSSFSVT